MKKQLLVLSILLIAIFSFTACRNDVGNTTEKTTTQEIATEAADDNQAEATTKTEDTSDYDIASYEKQVTSITKEVNQIPSNLSATKQKNYYQDLSGKIESVEHSLDILDDTLEADHLDKKLSDAIYRSLERQVEKLEDQLDLAEDTLETKCNIDD